MTGSLVDAALAAEEAATVRVNGTEYRSTTLSDVEPEKVTWLWPSRLPLGKLSVLDGDPDVGKSTLMLDLAARVTTGRPMPGEDLATVTASHVVLMTAEDGLADTIRPRLDAAGADPKRAHRLDAVPVRNDEGEVTAWVPPSIPEDLAALEHLIKKHGAVLVIVDVLTAFLTGRADSHRDQDVRRALAPLAEVAERTGACVVLLRHFRKAGGSALYAGGGSIGIIGAARSGLVAGKDPDDETGKRRVLARSKGNLAAAWRSVTYEIVEHGESIRVAWGGPSDITADQLLADRAVLDAPGSQDAVTALRAVLGESGRWVKEAIDGMADAGFTKDQARRAKERLGARSVHVGTVGDADQGWKWVPPTAPEGGTDAPKAAKAAGVQALPPSPPSEGDCRLGEPALDLMEFLHGDEPA